ncbi:MAG: 4-hydroxy-tetrahydrodipicolinate reductase [Peptococcaceae bacterium]|nr:4-hydroxy-tetrahydrodipicolinate reductase [Peptococcaceae bacterium]
MIKVVVSGAAGKMGKEMMKAIWDSADAKVVGAVDPFAEGVDIGSLMGIDATGILVRGNLKSALTELRPDVMVDFTTPSTVYSNICTAFDANVRPVVGTTGINEEQLETVKEMAAKSKTGCIIAPNFTIGALLLIKFAAEASKYFPNVEIIEMHHDGKIDAPSGTAIKTAEMIQKSRKELTGKETGKLEKIDGVRGGYFDEGLRIHSIRLPGMMAHQEVIFGGLGQTLTIRHDALSRDSYIPGLLLAINKVMELDKMVYGLENIIF